MRSHQTTVDEENGWYQGPPKGFRPVDPTDEINEGDSLRLVHCIPSGEQIPSKSELQQIFDQFASPDEAATVTVSKRTSHPDCPEDAWAIIIRFDRLKNPMTARDVSNAVGSSDSLVAAQIKEPSGRGRLILWLIVAAIAVWYVMNY